jgi:hypothetical protein
VPSKPAPSREPIECARPGCDERFVPRRSTAKYHSATCQRRASRQRKAVEHQVAEEAKTGTKDEHGLVKAVRIELEREGKVDTVDGQLALQLARRAADPTEPSLMSLSKEIRAVMAAAIGKPSAGADEAPAAEAEDDDVSKARKARDRKRAAAGQA